MLDKEIQESLKNVGINVYAVLTLPLDQASLGEFYTHTRMYLEKGCHADMDYLLRNEALRMNPNLVMPHAKSLLVCAMPIPRYTLGPLASYAHGRDYHKVLGKKLKNFCADLARREPGVEYKYFVDADPLHEKKFAELAGLGFIGRNTLLISTRFGSYLLLGLVLTSLELKQRLETDGRASCPDGCEACIQACPGRALHKPGYLEAGLCNSWITTASKKIVSQEQFRQLDGMYFGCDVCQNVCPWNKKISPSSENVNIDLKKILIIKNHDELSALYSGTVLMKAGRRRLLCNALALAARSKDNSLREYLELLTNDLDSHIAEQAKISLAYLLAKEL